MFTPSYEKYKQLIRGSLECCRKHGIALSARKFDLGKPEVNFFGFGLNKTGGTIDSAKTEALRDFPTSCNREQT